MPPQQPPPPPPRPQYSSDLPFAGGAGAPPPPPAPKRLPEGWAESEKGGGSASVLGLCPVKTPLSSSFDAGWTPADCIVACGKRAVKVVIDLTNTDRYYDKREVEALGIRHVKCKTEGRGVPSDDQMRMILHTLREVNSEAIPASANGPGNTPISIIHCTHGMNRTGYVICCALIEIHNKSLIEALEMFAAIRPPGIFREEYVKTLHERYGGPPPTMPTPPPWANMLSHEDSRGSGSKHHSYDRGHDGTVRTSLDDDDEGNGGNGGGGSGEVDLFAGAMVPDDTGATYYQDRRKQWPYRTDTNGHSMLKGMIDVAGPLLSDAVKSLEGTDRGMLREGEAIYAQKPNLGANGITWSQENYAHLGLQIEYLRLKSIQRFTESYAAMQRMHNSGAFAGCKAFAELSKAVADGAPAGSVPFRVASLGAALGLSCLPSRPSSLSISLRRASS